ncbi:MAG: alpha-amylase/4-alpha-glucanotransferase domain-containing protein [Sterolibacterium sp.]|jgi:alpha-amylase
MTINLLFGVHAHQPVGNFPEVIDDAHVRCYGMFLRVLEGYPEFRFSVHFSGWLLDVLRQRFPDDMALLAKMTARGQVEWFGSGDCEPVLAAIPQRDRLSQLETLSAKLERYVGQRPRGAWLTERVWESSVVPALADSGIRYVAVDDYHFLCAGTPAEALDSFYTTEEDDRTLDLFPISEALRYRLPFSPAAEAVAYLEQMAREGKRAAIYFDDIEKFGIWPETYNWVYERGWLVQFIEGVLASPLIRATTFAEYHAQAAVATRGVVYLPTTSYIEMNEWTLPSAAATEYAALIAAEKASGSYERHKPFLRGGIWRNFLSRYPESNWMHKRMLGLSARLAGLPQTLDPQRRESLRELLHRAQANDAYWHGLFGGLYLPHLRRAVWNNLLALEAALDCEMPRAAFERRDLDLDGREELVLHNAELQTIVRLDGDAGILELSSYATAHNFGDTLRRYAEGYHSKLASAQHAAPEQAGGITSAHDRIAFKHPIDAADTLADVRPRGICIDTLVAGDGSRHAIDTYYLVAASADGLAFTTVVGGGRIEKRLVLEASSLSVRYRATGLRTSRVEIQLNLAMPSCDGYSGRYILADGSIPCGFGQRLELADLRQITLEDGELHGRLKLAADRPLGLSAAPYFTASQSEAGFEKVMQAACLTLSWRPLSDSDTLDLQFTLSTSSS